jgi:salicyloyl-CoA 5-hydroxylase
VRVDAPDTEADLDRAAGEAERGLAAGACLVAVGGGTPLTRRLACEAARLELGAVTMLVEDGPAGADAADTARTAILSGRTDLVGVPDQAWRDD